MHDPKLNELAELVIGRVGDSVRGIVRSEVDQALQRSIADNEYFKNLNSQILSGLGNIYKEISAVRSGDCSGPRGTADEAGAVGAVQAKELMDDASAKLDQILQTTERSTFEIIDLVERQLALLDNMRDQLRSCDGSRDQVDRLLAMCDSQNEDFLQIITALSFQDLTGQRIKRVMDTLGKVGQMVYSLYMETGLALKARERGSVAEIESAREHASQQISQADVDALLAQLDARA